MLKRLPVRIPESTVVSLYIDMSGFREHGRFEIGLPRLGNGSTLGMLEEMLPMGLQITPGRSVLSTGLGASERIYTVIWPRRRTIDPDSELAYIVERLTHVRTRLKEFLEAK